MDDEDQQAEDEGGKGAYHMDDENQKAEDDHVILDQRVAVAEAAPLRRAAQQGQQRARRWQPDPQQVLLHFGQTTAYNFHRPEQALPLCPAWQDERRKIDGNGFKFPEYQLVTQLWVSV